MGSMAGRVLFLAGLGGLLAGVALSASQDLTKPEALSMDRKLTVIAERGVLTPPKNAKPLRTSFTEREANAYLKFFGPEVMPTGVVNPRVVIDHGGKLQARAVVDLDAVRKSRQRTMLDPMNLLFGTVEIAAAGTLQGAGGRGTFVLESATVGAVPVPKAGSTSTSLSICPPTSVRSSSSAAPAPSFSDRADARAAPVALLVHCPQVICSRRRCST